MDIGVCYFPEHWPRERWATDIEQMAAAGITYVRIGEFAWSAIEPEPGTHNFSWIETVLALLDEHGLQAVLCTPTAAPPKWLVDQHPEIHQQASDGTVNGFGSRRHYCYNSPVYREHTQRVVTALADRFSGADPVSGWQIDNEYGCHGTLFCYCSDCAMAFRDWLRDRYETIDRLNTAWGTAFWSQRYRSFDEIDPPRSTPADHHPSHLLDYHRFTNAGVVAYNRLQARILQAANDDWFVTHNFMCSHTELDPFGFRDALDFASWDVYPTGAPQTVPGKQPSREALRIGNADQLGLNHAWYRGVASDRFWVLEQQPGTINWPPYSPTPADGAMAFWAHHAVAHGADVVSYFRWRRCRSGQEQYHAGLRRGDGTPDRGYHDASRVAAELDGLADGEIDASVALVIDPPSLWALSSQPMAPSFDPWEQIKTYYTALRGRGITVAVGSPTDPLESYPFVVAPSLHLLDAVRAEHLTQYVESGGTLLTTLRTGEKTRTNRLVAGMAPGPLTATVGATVAEHETVPDQFETRVTIDGSTFGYHTWAEALAPTTATCIGTHAAGVHQHRPAITRNDVGDGLCYYVGVWPTAALADKLIGRVLSEAGIDQLDDRLPDTVRVASRGQYTWVFNFGTDSVTIAGDVTIGSATLEAYAYAVTTGSIDSLEIH